MKLKVRTNSNITLASIINYQWKFWNINKNANIQYNTYNYKAWTLLRFQIDVW